jgi:hypothetical protein
VYVVPDPKGESVSVVFSDSLSPDEDVTIDRIAGLRLTARDASGKETPLPLTKEKASLVGKIPVSKAEQLVGSVRYGVLAKGGAKPYLLVYHPVAVLGTLQDTSAVLGEKVPVQLVAACGGKGVRFRFLSGGKPVADSEVSVTKADGSKVKLVTDREGWTETVPGAGQFAAWARTSEASSGEHDGKKYEEIRHYATLVVTVGKN